MKKRIVIAALCAGIILSATACNTTPETTAPEAPQPVADEPAGDAVDADEDGQDEPAPELSEDEAWQNEPAYGQTIKVGYNGGLCLGGFGIAQAKGFYEAEGLEVEILSMQSAADGLGTGQVDVAGDHIATMLVPTVNGVNMTFTTGIHTGCKSLYVLADSGIETTVDMVGKTVALNDGIGASDHNITLRFLNHDGIDPNEVNFKVVTNDAVIQALQNGEIDGATLSDQFARAFLDDGTLKIIRSLTYDDDFGQETCCVHATNSDFLAQNPITAMKLTRAQQAARNWIEENKEEFVDIMLENNWASGDRDLVLSIAETYDFSISDAATEETLRSIINDYKTFGLIDESKDTEELLSQVWNPLVA